jgi:anti-sigma regulatory factor (Ser/Thr protein kinase)
VLPHLSPLNSIDHAPAPHALGLRRDVAAPAAARRSLEDWFDGALEPDVLSTAKLLTTELVTNAVIHGQGEISFRARLDERCLRVDVEDAGIGFAWPVRQRSPEREPWPVPERDLANSGGWGLFIVEDQSARCGVREGTGHVWFELAAPSA